MDFNPRLKVINLSICLTLNIIKLRMTSVTRKTMEFVMNDPMKIMRNFIRNERINFRIDNLINRILILLSFYMFGSIIGFFAYFRQHIWELFHQFFSLLSLLITIYLLHTMIDERFYLEQRFVTSLQFAIIGHNSRHGQTSYWLQLVQNLFNCCGTTDDAAKQFHHYNIPFTCCKSLNESMMAKMNSRNILTCKSDQKHHFKQSCIHSIYYISITYGFWSLLTVNLIFQITILNLIFRIYCRKYYD